jgi:AcrR family transcriptional regulator
MAIMSESDTAPPVSLRERKKAITRRAILDAAQRLFDERGYDHVTVAQIADAANVSVKTIFVYFRSKEDLAFSETPTLDEIVTVVRTSPGSPADALAAVLESAMLRVDTAETGAAFHRTYGCSPAVQSRMLRLWAELEDRLTQALAERRERASQPEDRYDAIKLVGMLRTLLAPETLAVAPVPAQLRRVLAALCAASGLS